MLQTRHLLAVIEPDDLDDSFASSRSYSDSTTLESRHLQMMVIHGWLMGAAFCLLLPLGLVVAHGFRGMGRQWIWVHVILQVLACLVSLTGIILMAFMPIRHTGHRSLGIICQILLGLQVVFGFARPTLQSTYRRLFNVSHWWMGRAAAAIGVAEVFYGLWLSQPPTAYFLIALFTLLAVCAIMVYRDLVLNMRLPPPAAALQVLQGAVSPKAAAMAAASAEAAGANPRDFVVDTTLEASPAALQMVKAHLQGELSDPMTSPGMASLSLGRNSLSPGS